MNKILLVEDEKNFAAVLKDYLNMNDFDVTLCNDGVSGMEAFNENAFDLCLIDVMMPKKDGFTLVQEIRQKNRYIPVIFLTAKTLRDDMLKGYKIGADDYITKPFDTELLLYKIKAVLNRKTQQKVELPTQHQLGLIQFDSKIRILSYDNGTKVRLSPKESELLLLLCEYKNDILPKEIALKKIWKEDNYFTGRSMDVFIAKLRKYLSRDEKIEIINLHGNGYRLLVK